MKRTTDLSMADAALVKMLATFRQPYRIYGQLNGDRAITSL
jgi:hypothetical protein